MKGTSILIVDDEKNVRLTLAGALEAPDTAIDTAADGEEALAKIKEKDYDLVLLDLWMPRMGGMEVLQRIHELRPDIRVIVITAHGTVDTALEATKLGAAEFIQKPFTPKEIRDLVSRVLDEQSARVHLTKEYYQYLERARRSIDDKQLVAAVEHARRALALDPGRPEAFNLIGAIMEMQGDAIGAQKNYRTALSLDPSYAPANENLERSTKWGREEKGKIQLG